MSTRATAGYARATHGIAYLCAVQHQPRLALRVPGLVHVQVRVHLTLALANGIEREHDEAALHEVQ